MRPVFALLSLLVACGAEDDTAAAWQCVVPQDLAAGTVDGALGGTNWSTDSAAYLWAGSSLQLNTVATDGWRLGVVAQRTTGELALDEALETGALPVEVALETGQEGGWALLYPDDGDSFATESGGGGLMVIDSQDEGELRGCLRFTATDGATSLDMDAVFRVAESSL